MINVSLLDKYNTEKDTKGFKISAFIYKYQDSIFSSRQMTNFFQAVGSANPQQQAKNYTLVRKAHSFRCGMDSNIVKIGFEMSLMLTLIRSIE